MTQLRGCQFPIWIRSHNHPEISRTRGDHIQSGNIRNVRHVQSYLAASTR